MSELATRLTSELDVSVGWTDDELMIDRNDHRIVVASRDDTREAWTVVVRADGATVSKFGPFHDDNAVCDQVRELLDTEVGYTVCCDG